MVVPISRCLGVVCGEPHAESEMTCLPTALGRHQCSPHPGPGLPFRRASVSRQHPESSGKPMTLGLGEKLEGKINTAVLPTSGPSDQLSCQSHGLAGLSASPDEFPRPSSRAALDSEPGHSTDAQDQPNLSVKPDRHGSVHPPPPPFFLWPHSPTHLGLRR